MTKAKGKHLKGLEASISKPSVGRVSNAVINQGWRPRTKVLKELGIPQCMRDLIGMCWLDDPAKRPSFGEILEYLEGEAMIEIMPDLTLSSKSGTNRTRRASTSGALKGRIKAQQALARKGDPVNDDRKGRVRIDERSESHRRILSGSS